MNLDLEKLTQLAKLFDASSQKQETTDHPAAHLIGRFVIVRARDSGVHAGLLVSAQDRTVHLQGARRLWYWHAAHGHTLNGVAIHGLKTGKSKIAGAVAEIVILDACEIIGTTSVCEKSITSEPEYEPS